MLASNGLICAAQALAARAEDLEHQALRDEESARSFAVYALHGATSAEERALVEAEAARLGEKSIVAANASSRAAELAAQLYARAQRLAVRGE